MNEEFGPIAESNKVVEVEGEPPELPEKYITLQRFIEFANNENASKSPRAITMVWGHS